MWQKLKTFLKDTIQFLKNVANDPRIPDRDKTVLLALVALVLSPFDIIPDWIPILGLLDNVIILAIILDYFFERLDVQILLSHYPWGMKSFTWLRRLARMVSGLTPTFFKKWIWKYEKPPY